jgi:hypothetical protein
MDWALYTQRRGKRTAQRQAVGLTVIIHVSAKKKQAIDCRIFRIYFDCKGQGPGSRPGSGPVRSGGFAMICAVTAQAMAKAVVTAPVLPLSAGAQDPGESASLPMRMSPPHR